MKQVKTPSVFKATPKACSDITWNRGAAHRKRWQDGMDYPGAAAQRQFTK